MPKRKANIETRNEEPDEMVHVGGSPNWLDKYEDNEDRCAKVMREYRIIPRLSIAQGATEASQRLIEAVGLGSACIPASQTLVAKRGESFAFVPLFFYREFIQWRDRNDPDVVAGSVPKIVERTFDDGHRIALLARDRDKREEEYGKTKDGKTLKYRYQEHLEFIGVLYDGELAGTEVMIGFKRGEFRTGRQFINKIAMRFGGKKAKLWATVWEFSAALHKSSENSWYGFDIAPPKLPWIRSENVEAFREQHNTLADDFGEKLLRADTDEDDTGVVNSAESEAATPQGDL